MYSSASTRDRTAAAIDDDIPRSIAQTCDRKKKNDFSLCFASSSRNNRRRCLAGNTPHKTQSKERDVGPLIDVSRPRGLVASSPSESPRGVAG
jgi:hypothetical protein